VAVGPPGLHSKMLAVELSINYDDIALLFSGLVLVFTDLRILVQWNSTYPDAGCPDQLDPSGKFVKNSTN